MTKRVNLRNFGTESETFTKCKLFANPSYGLAVVSNFVNTAEISPEMED